MILQALVELKGRIDELQGDDAFEERRVDFLLVIDGAGKLIGVESQRGEDGKGRPMQIPRMPKRSGIGTSPSFLVDNAKYVLGLSDPEKPTKTERLLAMRESFSARTADAAQQTSDAGLLAVQRFYEQFTENLERIFHDRPHAGWTGNELLAFRLIDDVEAIHLRPQVAQAWSSARSRTSNLGEVDQAAEGVQPKKAACAPQSMRCLVTGVLGPAARLHPSLKRVPGGLSAGTSLVAFNSASFESHSHSQGENAPVSLQAATAYGDVLNWMLAEDPTLGWKRPHRYGVRIGDDAVVLFWAKESRKAMDAFALFANPPPTPHEAIAAIESAWKGLASVDDAMPFYALTLGGNSARAVVRDWIETTMGRLKAALERYFDDLALVGAEDRHGRKPLPISLLVKALDPPGSASLPPDLGAKLFRASIDVDGALPREVLRLALMRLRVPSDGDLRERKSPPEMLHARCALIKATLRGIARRTDDPARRKDLEVQMALDPENTNPGYVLGRLFAVLERLQGAALNDLNATIRDRYFGGASSSPASVFGRLLSLSTKHLSKLGGGLEHLFEERLRVVMRNLDGGNIPSHLSLEGQGLFAIGYFHERDWMIEDARARSEKKKHTDSTTTV